MKIWEKAAGVKQQHSIDCFAWRIVESQSVLSSRNLVDTREEHEILEEMIEASKPIVEKTTDYLIFTAFRYPPLKYGSRFGTKFQPSLWYGSLDVETALAEIAYYRLLFLHHTDANLDYINMGLTAYQGWIKTKHGIDLTLKPFSQYEKYISSKSDYSHSQPLGSEMRDSGIEAFIYLSARAVKPGKNIAAFTQKVFHKKNNRHTFNFQTWQCTANKYAVEFVHPELMKQSFTIDDFSTKGKFDLNSGWEN